MGANVQLWTCRKDNKEGFASPSYGNQKFDLMKDGTFSNSRTGFCLTAHKGEGDETNGANVHINKCGSMPAGKEGDQVFFWKAVIGDADFTRLVEVRDSVQLPATAATGSPAAFTAMAAGACASLVLVAVAVCAPGVLPQKNSLSPMGASKCAVQRSMAGLIALV